MKRKGYLTLRPVKFPGVVVPDLTVEYGWGLRRIVADEKRRVAAARERRLEERLGWGDWNWDWQNDCW